MKYNSIDAKTNQNILDTINQVNNQLNSPSGLKRDSSPQLRPAYTPVLSTGYTSTGNTTTTTSTTNPTNTPHATVTHRNSSPKMIPTSLIRSSSSESVSKLKRQLTAGAEKRGEHSITINKADGIDFSSSLSPFCLLIFII
jgi:hypothetical protein